MIERANISFRPQFEEVGSFHEGLAAIKQNGKWSFIDKNGQFVIPLEYDAASHFFDGLASVGKSGRFGFIDPTGKVIIPLRFFKLSSFSEGLAVAATAEGQGYIDKTGEMVIPPLFEEATDFKKGIATVFFKNQWQIIGKSGKIILRPLGNPKAQHLAIRIIGESCNWYDSVYRIARSQNFDPNGSGWLSFFVWDHRVTYFTRQKLVQIEEDVSIADGSRLSVAYFYDTAGHRVPHFVNYISDGNLFLLREDYPKAISAFYKALEINPGDPAAEWGIIQAKKKQKSPPLTKL